MSVCDVLPRDAASQYSLYSINGASQQSSYNPFGGAGGSSSQQGPSSTGNALVNLDASSLLSSTPQHQMAQENAIKNPFGPKLQAQNTGGSGKFQWDSKPAPMTLAQMAAANSSGGSIGRSNTMPNAGGQAPLFGSGAPNASWTAQQQPPQQQQQFGQGGQAFGQQSGHLGGTMMGGYPQQQSQQQQPFGGPFGGQQPQQQQPQFGTPFQQGQQQPQQQQQFQQNQNHFPGQKPNGYQGNLF